MKTDTVFKRAFNDALDLVSKLGDGEALPSENSLSARLGVSRTTVRKILSTLGARGVVGGSGRQRFVAFGRGSHAAISRSGDGPHGRTGRETLHGVDAAGQCAPGNRHQRTRTRPAVRRRDHRHSRVPQPVPALRAHREAAERRLGVQRVHGRASRSSSSKFARCLSCGRRGPLRPCRRARRCGSRSKALRDEHVALLSRNRAALSTTSPISTAGFTASSIRPRPTGSSTTSTTSSR